MQTSEIKNFQKFLVDFRTWNNLLGLNNTAPYMCTGVGLQTAFPKASFLSQYAALVICLLSLKPDSVYILFWRRIIFRMIILFNIEKQPKFLVARLN